jgi:tetraether lipid synthase
MQLRDHTFLGMTQSLCPDCLELVPAKIIVRDNGRVYFRKRCPAHGVRDDFVCSDVRQYDRMEFSLPGKVPPIMGVEPTRGCPFDCGLCTEHEQHTCVGLVEITSSCNLACPMCYAHSGPGGNHLSLSQCRAAIDRLVEVEGRPEVLQLSGGEPTIHPQFPQILEYACRQPIDIVMINTNGIRISHDTELAAQLADVRHRLEVYFQFDGFDDAVYRQLRGEPLLEIKLRAIEALGVHGIRTTLVTTLQTGVNDDQVGRIVKFGLERPWITGVSFQPATYSGRFVLPDQLEERITFPDVVRAVAEQTDGLFAESDFMPLPCAHPNCHSLSYAYRTPHGAVPLTRFIDAQKHLDLLANGITFTRPRARELIEQYLGSQGCCGGACGTASNNSDEHAAPINGLAVFEAPSGARINGRAIHDSRTSRIPAKSVGSVPPVAEEFFTRALAEDLSPSDVFRITITSFLDAYNFDVRRLMKCCIHHVLPSGHIIPFCAYNVLYRDGHVPLPAIQQSVEKILAHGTAAELVENP